MSDLDKKEIKFMCEKIEMIKNTVENLKAVKEQLIKEALTDKNKTKTNKKLVAKLDGHIIFLEETYKDVENKMKEKITDEEKKEEKLRIVRTAYFIAVVYQKDFAGYTPELIGLDPKKLEDMPDAKQTSLQAAYANLFSKKYEPDIKPERVAAIMQDEEFQDMMATGDTDRLERQQEEVNKQNKEVLKELKIFTQIDPKKLENMSEDELMDYVIRDYQNCINGFNHSLNTIKDQMANCVKEGKDFNQMLYSKKEIDMNFAGATPDLLIYKTPDVDTGDLWKMSDIAKEVGEIAAESKRLQKDFLRGKHNARNAKGYTSALIEREKRVLRAADKYYVTLQKKLHEVSTKEDEKRINQSVFMRHYLVVQVLITNGKRQLMVDESLYKNSYMNQRMREWEIYKSVTEKRAQLGEAKAKELDTEFDAWGKVGRMRRECAKYDTGTMSTALNTAIIATQSMLDICTVNKPLTEAEFGILESNLAFIIMYNHVLEESAKPESKRSELYNAVSKASSDKELQECADQIKKLDSFAKLKNKLLENPDKRNFIAFLAGDMEKKLKILPDLQKNLQK